MTPHTKVCWIFDFLHKGVVTQSIVFYYIRSAGMVTMKFVKKTKWCYDYDYFLPLIQKHTHASGCISCKPIIEANSPGYETDYLGGKNSLTSWQEYFPPEGSAMNCSILQDYSHHIIYLFIVLKIVSYIGWKWGVNTQSKFLYTHESVWAKWCFTSIRQYKETRDLSYSKSKIKCFPSFPGRQPHPVFSHFTLGSSIRAYKTLSHPKSAARCECMPKRDRSWRCRYAIFFFEENTNYRKQYWPHPYGGPIWMLQKQ